MAEAQPAHSTSQTGWSGQEVAQTSQTSWSGHDYYASQPALSQQANQYNQQQQQQQSAQVSQGSIADVLAAASDRVVERCGYQYNEGLDMYYDANSGLYYHQVSLYVIPYLFNHSTIKDGKGSPTIQALYSLMTFDLLSLSDWYPFLLGIQVIL